ncbi:serine/threonine-protein kinase [Streptomyces diastaticus]|uniref:serine/threonine-protein kinase n=1 Tax=Streptomyces diastaticus TaxID=1956 RepID=UPI0035DB8C3D
MHGEGRSNQPGGGPAPGPPARHTVIDDRYELLEPVGSGGMGEVWKAYDRRLRRYVAVKGLLDRTAMAAETQQTAMQRARREAEAIAKIEHQNVVTVHDQVETDNQVWIVMKLLEARSLADLLRAERVLGVPRAADIGLQIVQGLRAVHRASVLHRDVKPGNVLVREDGLAILVDFGIATFTGADRVTRHGSVIGTPPYLAPELFAPASPGPTPASDLWALGVTLYEMAEGRVPFGGQEVWEVQENIRQSPDPVIRYAGPLAPVIQGLLITDPAERLDAASAEAMLREVLQDDPAAPHAAVAARPTQAADGPAPEPAEPAPAPVPPAPGQPSAAPEAKAGGARGLKAVAAVVAAALLAGGGWFLARNAGGDDQAGPPGGGGEGAAGNAAGQQWAQWRKDHPDLRIGVKADQPGLSLYDKKADAYEGFDVAMAHAVADHLGYGEDEVVLRQVTTDNRSSKLANGDVDLVVASYSITDGRKEKEGVDFAGPYYKAGRSFLVREKSRMYDLDSPLDLKVNKVEVCTAQGSTYEQDLTKQGFTMRKWQPATYQECVDELLDPKSDVYAVASDDVLLAGYANDRPGKLKLLENGRGTEGYGVAMRLGDGTLKHKVCEGLQDILTGSGWEEMYEEHLAGLMKNKPQPRKPQPPECAKP